MFCLAILFTEDHYRKDCEVDTSLVLTEMGTDKNLFF